MGKIVIMSFEEKIMQEIGKWTEELFFFFYDSEKISTPGVGLPPPRGNIHVY